LAFFDGVSKKPKTLDEMTSGLLECLGDAQGLDELRDAGIDAKLVGGLEATMPSKGLDPDRRDDVQAMLAHMIDTVYPRLMN
jgi:hypothetical protein